MRIECENIEALYEQLSTVATEHLQNISKETILEDLGAQGRVFPAFLGHGIAIPHVYCEALNHRVCFIAQIATGLEIPGQDEAINFVFFLLSPTGDTEGHLATLAEIAKSCRSERLRNQMNSAESIDDVILAINN